MSNSCGDCPLDRGFGHERDCAAPDCFQFVRSNRGGARTIRHRQRDIQIPSNWDHDYTQLWLRLQDAERRAVRWHRKYRKLAAAQTMQEPK